MGIDLTGSGGLERQEGISRVKPEIVQVGIRLPAQAWEVKGGAEVSRSWKHKGWRRVCHVNLALIPLWRGCWPAGPHVFRGRHDDASFTYGSKELETGKSWYSWTTTGEFKSHILPPPSCFSLVSPYGQNVIGSQLGVRSSHWVSCGHGCRLWARRLN